jgi:23S rRNA (adenine2030-N6)-methyltransferase
VLDTHAGRGRYELPPEGGEATQGIGRLLAARAPDALPALARYLGIVTRLNPDAALRAYPGSPLIATALLRATDRVALCELQPSEAGALRQLFRDDPRVAVHERDGYEALGALLPPRERRGLALIDPPYEEQDRDFSSVCDALVATAARWREGVLMAWYPIKQGEIAARLHRRLLAAGLRRLLVAELCVHPDDSRAGLNGSGLVIVNAPWRLDEDLRQLLPALHASLAARGAGRTRVELIANE